jgi:DNA-binding MarR family transcriptional regulator
MEISKKENIEREQAGLLVALSLQIEKFCQIKEKFLASKFKLTPAEIRCLSYIKDNIKITTNTIARDMNLSAGRVTHLLNSLEKGELIKRQIDGQDRRSILISLTEKANKLIDRVFEEYVDLQIEVLKYLPENRREKVLNEMQCYFDAFKRWVADLN